MRFAFVSTMGNDRWGGSEELWSQAARRLKSDAHQVSASVIFWPKLSPKLADLAQYGIEVFRYFSYYRSSNHPGLAFSLWRKVTSYHQRRFQHLLKDQPDLVVISQGGFGCDDGLDCMNYCLKMALPFVLIIHCNSESWWPNDDKAFNLARAYRAARKVFCVSRRNLDLIECQIGESLPNAMVVRNPYSVSPDHATSWPSETGSWHFASVARLEPAAKGQDLLFQVLAGPQWRHRAIEVNLYGTGPCELNLRRLAERLQLKMVHFHGHVNDVKAIWEHNHMLILPSRFEGLPLALVEAMWCGRPAVVTDIAGCPELCVDGETGFIAAAPAAGLLEQAMESAWDRRMDWRRMGIAARSRVEQIIPRDPVAEFCKQLVACAST